MSTSNETRKPAGRPSLLSAEQQNALEQQKTAPAVAPAAAPAPRRKHAWLAAGVTVLAIAATFAVVQSGDAEAPAVTLAAAPQAAPPAAAPAVTPAPEPAAPEQPAAADDAAAAPPAVAAIVDEAPPQPEAKPKDSLAQMLESGVPAPAKPAAPKVVRKPAKQSPAKVQDRAIAAASPEEDNDVELLAALVAHAKYDSSANARMTLPKALEQCKKQGKQDAARCRIRVCDGRWKKDECRVYNRSKLEKAASGS